MRRLRTVALADVAEVRGGIQKQGKRRPVKNKYPFLRVANVARGRLVLDEVHEVELFEGELDRYRLQRGDLLVVEGNGSSDQIGRAAVWDDSIPDCVHQNHLIRVRPGPELLPEYLGLAWNSPAVSTQVQATAASTSGLYTLSTTKLKRIGIPYYPLGEQRRIVEILEDHLSRIDSASIGLRTALQRISAYQSSSLTACREGDERALAELAIIQGGIQKQQKRAPGENAYPFLRVANVTARGLDLGDVHKVELFAGELERFRLQEGDLLVVEGNGSPSQIGRASLWDGSIEDCVHQNHLIRVRALPGLHPAYLEAVWNSPQTRRQLTNLASSSSGLHTLSVFKIKSLRIPLPSADRQQHLIARVTDMRDWSRRLGAEVLAAEERVGRLRLALLSAGFSGRLTGRSTDMEVAEEMVSV